MGELGVGGILLELHYLAPSGKKIFPDREHKTGKKRIDHHPPNYNTLQPFSQDSPYAMFRE